MQACTACGGTGRIEGAECDTCKGVGEVADKVLPTRVIPIEIVDFEGYKGCTECGGTGNGGTCLACDGRGYTLLDAPPATMPLAALPLPTTPLARPKWPIFVAAGLWAVILWGVFFFSGMAFGTAKANPQSTGLAVVASSPSPTATLPSGVPSPTGTVAPRPTATLTPPGVIGGVATATPRPTRTPVPTITPTPDPCQAHDLESLAEELRAMQPDDKSGLGDPTTRRKFLQGAAIAAATATVAGTVATLAGQPPQLVHTFGPQTPALSGGTTYATDLFTPSGPNLPQDTEINSMSHSTVGSAWVPTGWQGVEVPQAAASAIQSAFPGKCITRIVFQAAAFLPNATAASQLAAEPIFFKASTDHGATWFKVPANVSAPGEIIDGSSPNSWYRFTWYADFPTGTNVVQSYFRDVQDGGIHAYWVQAGRADFTLVS